MLSHCIRGAVPLAACRARADTVSRFELSSNRSTASHAAVGSRGSMRVPLVPTTSGVAPQADTTTGVPRVIASSAGRQNVSRQDIETNTAAES